MKTLVIFQTNEYHWLFGFVRIGSGITVETIEYTDASTLNHAIGKKQAELGRQLGSNWEVNVVGTAPASQG